MHLGDGSTSQPSGQGAPKRHRRDRLAMVVPNDESLPRHVLVLPDAARHEIACASDGLRESRVAVGKVDPLQVLEDLIAVENVKIKSGARSETALSKKMFRFCIEKAVLQGYIGSSVAIRIQVRPAERDVRSPCD